LEKTSLNKFKVTWKLKFINKLKDKIKEEKEELEKIPKDNQSKKNKDNNKLLIKSP